MPDMSVTCETSHDDISPLKDCAFRNMSDMSVTPDRSGVSSALYVSSVALWNAPAMLPHFMEPHCSMDCSFAAFALLLPAR